MSIYTESDIWAAVRQAADECTDDCSYGGILSLAAIILNVSEDTMNDKLNDDTDDNDVCNEYYKTSDGFFTYYTNVKTGEQKFELASTEKLVDNKPDDFIR